MQENLSEKWSKELCEIASELPHLAEIESVASGFNTNIDAIVNISGIKLAEAIKKFNIPYDFLMDNENRTAEKINDVIRGIFKCFTLGIAEEWTSKNNLLCKDVFALFPAEKMQMGGQGGIIANLLSICKIKKVIAHTNSLPELQAKLFLTNDNLLGFGTNSEIKQIRGINRADDNPLVHIIFEFKKGDSFELFNQKFICPKSNRFIMSCDELNQNMVLDNNFITYLQNNPLNYFFLSGFHMLDHKTAESVLPKIKSTLQDLKKGSQKNCIIHLEIASTSDIKARKMIIDEIGKTVDSIGLNEREAIDFMGAVFPDKNFQPNAADMYEAIRLLQQYTLCPRIELHMLGLFLTIQKKDYIYSPEQTKNGMLLAARIGNSRAALGDLKEYNDLLYSDNVTVSDIGFNELQHLAEYLSAPCLTEDGIFYGEKFDLIAVPAPLEIKPKSLVGMGDTISSVSLIGTR